MASRDKKVSLARKQASASPVPPKEGTTSETSAKTLVQKTETSVADEAPKLTPIKPKNTAPKTAKIKKSVGKPVIKKTITLKAKTKAKLNQKLGKKLLTNAREIKKTLLKNGVKRKIIRRKKTDLPLDDPDDKPPVLEPIYPINENVKQTKKRPKKTEEDKKIKNETVEGYCSITNTIESIINQYNTDPKPPKKTKAVKKIKAENSSIEESIEEVMKDLSYLIKSDEAKPEPETAPDLQKPDAKPRKANPKSTKMDLLKKSTAIKKENLEVDDIKLIDMLDLNVAKKEKKIIRNRRHSIEKYPIDYIDTNAQSFSVFSNLPRSISPKSKRASKVRQSVDILSSTRRASPYSTRSDSPARILRNGKHRKLRDNLLDGLDSEYKKRRRLCSDYSGSEISVSKSGYESDSSFSDLASLHGAENSENFESSLKLEVKKESPDISPGQNADSKSLNKIPAILKRSISTESPNSSEIDHKAVDHGFDSNSNLCDMKREFKNELEFEDNQRKLLMKDEGKNEYPDTPISPSVKVPEKSIILDSMKQTFNDLNAEEAQDKEKRTTRSSVKKPPVNNEDKHPEVNTNKFYGNADTFKFNSVNKDEVDSQESLKLDTPNRENGKEDIPNLEEIVDKIIAEMDSVENKKSDNNGDEQPPVLSEEETEENISENKIMEVPETSIETAESLDLKESILQALGLQSLKAAEEARLRNKEKLVPKQDLYTGTLKTVIKLNRPEKKRARNCLKMTLQKNKKGAKDTGDNDLLKAEEDGYKTTKEVGGTSWKSHGGQSSDTAGALRKSHYANRSNMDGSSEHTSDGDTAPTEDGAGKLLVIPEKASSFSIHPGRLCKDECTYCFGKFGLFDTPCHIAQMKSVERQDKILATEKHLTRDSCLCDACYRHVDRKSNTPSYANKSFKRSNLVAPGPRQNHCHVLGCKNVSTNILRRKWIIKMRKNVCRVINIDLDNPGLHSIPICEEHYAALEHLMVCAMCKRRLARNHFHYLGSESNDLNMALNEMGIPVKLHDKPLVCKLCKYFATLVLKNEDDRPENTAEFYKEYTKRLLHFHDVKIMKDTEAGEPIPVPARDTKPEKETTSKKKKKLSKSDVNSEPPVLEPQVDVELPIDQTRVPSAESRSTEASRSESPSDYMVDYNTLIPNIALECNSDAENLKKEASKKQMLLKKIPRPESVKEAVEISKNIKLKNKSDIAVQRLGSNPSISVRQLFPGEEDLPLQGNIEFHNIKERTPEGWEKCSTTIQYDIDTKHLWQELQKPYGNQSSFLRHLILLEKYFRNGDLVLSPNASHHAMNYSESVQNRLRAYDNTPTSSGPIQPLVMIPFNKAQKSTSGIITSKDNSQNLTTMLNAANIPKNTPITISQLNNNPSFLVQSSNKQKTTSVPPGLMPLQPGTNRPLASLVKVPQSQKIKFPITKNWRPNLIPIDPNKKLEKKSGLVQVISGGKPYHITLEDYKKMCAIKRTFDLRQKKLQEAQKAKLENQKLLASTNSSNSLLKTMAPRKSLVISKTSALSSPIHEQNYTELEKEESSLEKLDKQVEKLESKLNDSKSVMILPKIPKSLTVIPQTVTRKPSRPPSPALLITPKPKASIKS